MKKLLLTLALLLTLVLAFSACDGGETPGNQEHTHAFGEWITVKEPTDIEEGKKVRVCFCGEQETQVIPAKRNEDSDPSTDTPAHTHVYDQQNTASTYLKSAATCESAATYYYSCSCGAKGTSTFESGSLASHSYTQRNTSATYLKSEATETSPAVYYYSCSCGEKGTETFLHGDALVNTLALNYAPTADYSFYVVTGVTGRGSTLEIPAIYDGLRVVGIADGAFKNNTSLVRVVLPNTIESIGKNAFYGCTGLASVTIPDSVTSIGSSAFRGCTGLASVTIPDSITSIGDYAFYGCKGLTSVTIPDSVTSIGDYAFCYCTGLTSVTIGNGVTSIGEDAFYGCKGLTSVTITDSVTSIGEDAFTGCTGLTSVTIPSSVTSIGKYAFYNCTGLESITLPFVGANKDGTSNTHFGYIFGAHSYSGNDDYVPTSLKTVVITGGTSIGSSAFEGCTGLTSVTIPDSVTSIGYNAFYNCTGLTSVHITDLAAWCEIWFSNVYANPLYYAKNLYLNGTLVTNLVIPDSVTSIGYYAFSGCTGLESITLPFVGANKDGTSNTHFGYIFGAASYSDNLYYVPASLKTVVITGGKSIGDYAFENCTGLASVTIPDSVTSIGKDAFLGCKGLTSVHVTDLAAWCEIWFSNVYANPLYYAKNLYLNGTLVTSLVIPDIITSIGDYAFRDCTALTSVTIPDSVTSIGSSAFENCTGLTSVTIPDSVKNIDSYAFYNCTGLTSVHVTDLAAWCEIWFSNVYANPLYYAKNLYLNGTLVTNLVIPDSVTSIGYYAFSGCTGLTSVTIPSSVRSIGEKAFYHCTGLTSIRFGGTTAQWRNVSKGSGWAAATPTLTVYCTDGTYGTTY